MTPADARDIIDRDAFAPTFTDAQREWLETRFTEIGKWDEDEHGSPEDIEASAFEAAEAAVLVLLKRHLSPEKLSEWVAEAVKNEYLVGDYKLGRALHQHIRRELEL